MQNPLELIVRAFLSSVSSHPCPLQEQRRRAPRPGQRTGRSTSSWLWKTGWRSARGTSPRSSRRSGSCSMSPRWFMSSTWRASSRASWTAPPSGRPRSASTVRPVTFFFSLKRRTCMQFNTQWETFTLIFFKWKLECTAEVFTLSFPEQYKVCRS